MPRNAIWLGLTLVLLAGCSGQDYGNSAVPAVQPAAKPEVVARADFRQTVQSAKDKVFPAVVYIKCLRESHESGKKQTYEVAGSGVIISTKGEVLTNWHVVDKAVEIRCLLYDGRAFDAKLVGSDKDTDLALVQLQETEKSSALPIAQLGDSSQLKEGDFVMAMGAPWGLSRSVSIGIISCTRRFLPQQSQYSLWLQTDASISPGNSGGPLVNTDGQVIGINTLGANSGGDLGFAVPSGTIRIVWSQLHEFGKMNWTWTGLQLQPLRDFEHNQYFQAEEGVVVADTDEDSPAKRAGISSRDRILKINGKKVTALTDENLPELRTELGLLPKQSPVEIVLDRGGTEISFTVTPREKGKVEGEELDCPRWDLTVKSINQFDNPELYLHRQKGVYVLGVKPRGNARDAGLNEQDIILKIEDKDIVALDDVKALHAKSLETVKENHRLRFTVLRNGLMRQIILDFLRDYEKE
jgi:serine protease Do